MGKERVGSLAAFKSKRASTWLVLGRSNPHAGFLKRVTVCGLQRQNPGVLESRHPCFPFSSQLSSWGAYLENLLTINRKLLELGPEHSEGS